LVLAAGARARRFDWGRGAGPTRRLPFLARSLAAAAWALPLELARTRRLDRRAVRVAQRDVALPRRTGRAPASVLYLRTDPALSWHGHKVGGAATHTSGVINGLVANGLAVDVVASERLDWSERAGFTPVPLARVYHFASWLTYAAHGERIA